MDARTRALLHDPVTVQLLRLVAPNSLMSTVQAAVVLTETYFVAELGTDSLTGMALVIPILMLAQMVWVSEVRGGILSAVSRALSGKWRDKAHGLVWHTKAIAAALRVLSTVLVLLFRRALYAAMGGIGGSLDATTYSTAVFAGAFLVSLSSASAAVLLRTSNLTLPAIVMCGGEVAISPVSPTLIFHCGSILPLDINGGAGVLTYSLVGTVIFAAYLWLGRGALRQLRFQRHSFVAQGAGVVGWPLAADILRVFVSLRGTLVLRLRLGDGRPFVPLGLGPA